MFYLFNLSTNLAFIEVEHFTYPNLRLVGLLFFILLMFLFLRSTLLITLTIDLNMSSLELSLYIPFRLCSSYMFLIYDVFPKLAYFVCIYVTPMFTTYFNSFSFRIRLAQLVGFHFFAKFIITNKHHAVYHYFWS